MRIGPRLGSLVVCSTALVAGVDLSAAEAATRKYTVFQAERAIGWQRTTVTPSKLVSDLDIKFNGSGPTSHVEYTFGRDGQLIGLRMTGKTAMGQPIYEEFAMDAGLARWHTNADRGEARIPPGTRHHYLTNEYLPNDLALLASHARRGGRAEVTVLPNGVAAIAKLASHRLQAGKRRIDAEIFAIDRVNIEPAYVWLDRDGGLLAFLFGAFAIIRDDAIPARAEFERLQRDADAERTRAIAASAMRPAADLTVIKNVALFDPASGRRSPKATVFLSGDRISAIYDREVPVPSSAQEVDGSGGTLLPGLWDMHTHLHTRWNGVQHLAGGVTNVRDIGNDHAALAKLRAAFDTGDALGPHVVASGFIEGKSATNSPTGIVAETREQALEAVEWYAQRGYRAIKLYTSIAPGWVPEMVGAAHAHGMHVSGHIPAFMRARDAVAAGYDEINHIIMLVLNFVQKDGEETWPLRFTAVGERAAALDLTSREVRAFIEEFKRRDVVVDPTVGVYVNLLASRDGQLDPVAGPLLARLPATVARRAYRGVLPIADAEMDRTYAASSRKLLEMVKLLHDCGVRLVPGTDGWAGMGLIRELQLYVEAGIPPADVLRIATIGSATVAGEAHDRGSLEPGKYADLVIVDGDPLTDIRALERVRVVVSEGRVMDGRALASAAGLLPY